MNEQNEKLLEEYLKYLPVSRSQLEYIGFFDAPASRSHHLAIKGGLAIHSLNVTRNLLHLTDALCIVWPRPQSPYIIGMLHDLCKVKSYRLDGDAIKKVKSEYHGHGSASAMIAMCELGVNLFRVECAAIQHHMGAFGLEGEELDELDAALEKYPVEIIATHTADMLASRADEHGFRGT